MALRMPTKALIVMIHTQRNQLFLANSQQLQKKQNTYVVIKMGLMMESKPNG